MCKVCNKHAGDAAPGAVYIGRGSCWGNPFRIGADGDRAQVIARYESWLRDQHALLRKLDALRGRDLICFCAPRPCHGDLLHWLANADRDLRITWFRRRIVCDPAAGAPSARRSSRTRERERGFECVSADRESQSRALSLFGVQSHATRRPFRLRRRRRL